jgi:hypothetical protein
MNFDLGNSVALPAFPSSASPGAALETALDPRSFGFSKIAYSVNEGGDEVVETRACEPMNLNNSAASPTVVQETAIPPAAAEGTACSRAAERMRRHRERRRDGLRCLTVEIRETEI